MINTFLNDVTIMTLALASRYLFTAVEEFMFALSNCRYPIQDQHDASRSWLKGKTSHLMWCILKSHPQHVFLFRKYTCLWQFLSCVFWHGLKSTGWNAVTPHWETLTWPPVRLKSLFYFWSLKQAFCQSNFRW